jgi:hypothetical protein
MRFGTANKNSPGGASSAIKVAGILGRNYPLVLLLVLIGALFWPTESDKTPQTVAVDLKTPGLHAALRYLTLAPALWEQILAWQFRHSRHQGVPP